MRVTGRIAVQRHGARVAAVPNHMKTRSRRSLILAIVACALLGAPARQEQGAGSPPPSERRPPSKRVMASLFGGFVATQALDVHSTLRAINSGSLVKILRDRHPPRQ